MATDKELDAIARGLQASAARYEANKQQNTAKMMDGSKPRRVPQPPLPPKKSRRDWEILSAFRNR